uniref:Coiled-coil domain-containing protein n=2 Tax=Aegilops tauschii subsp. strangulata TaxID=200361 RepID=A0A453CN39_AEGTS
RKANRVGAPAPKVTEAELVRRREEERLRLEREAEAAKKRAARTAEEEEYERVVLVANTNRDDSVIEASGVDEAIVRLSLVDTDAALPADRHPERRLKASFKAFEEAELPRLKEEKPGLTLKQYKDMIWKLWKKSPDNPLNKVCSYNSICYLFFKYISYLCPIFSWFIESVAFSIITCYFEIMLHKCSLQRTDGNQYITGIYKRTERELGQTLTIDNCITYIHGF